MRSLGWFDLSTPAADGRQSYLRPLDHPYLWMNEMEWRPLRDICGGDQGFFNFAQPNLIPFAFTGGGDHWCWFPTHTNKGRVPVVLCPRDDMIGHFYAPDLLAAMYRQILDYSLYLRPEDEPTARLHFARWLRDLTPLFPTHFTKTVKRLSEAPLLNNALLTRDDYDSIVARDLHFPKLNDGFQWMID